MMMRPSNTSLLTRSKRTFGNILSNKRIAIAFIALIALNLYQFGLLLNTPKCTPCATVDASKTLPSHLSIESNKVSLVESNVAPSKDPIAAPIVPIPPPVPSVLSPSTALNVGLLCVILSATRPGGVDHVTDLSHLLHGVVDKIAVFDADPVSQRTFPWVDEIVRAPQDHINKLVDLAIADAKNNKHPSDPVTRIKWRAKNALDYAFALEYAYTQREQYPFALVLEDDVWFAEGFESRLRELVSWDEKTRGVYFAWTLFHSENFDEGRRYMHGDPFVFKACTQAMLYHSSQLKGLVAFTKANYAEDPFDWLERNYQYDKKLRINAVIPSLVQHTANGGGSTLADKKAEVKAVGCHAFDFTNPTPKPTKSRQHNNPVKRIEMETNGVQPDQTPRPRSW